MREVDTSRATFTPQPGRTLCDFFRDEQQETEARRTQRFR